MNARFPHYHVNAGQNNRNTILFSFFGVRRRISKTVFWIGVGVVFSLVVIFFVASPPPLFPDHRIFEIKKGMTLGQVSMLFKQEGLIRSRAVFEFCAISFQGEGGVLSGKYFFRKPIGACGIARRVVRGMSGIPAIRITIPEGASVKGVSEILAKSIPDFDAESFLRVAEKKEGYLFPDTYFFRIDESPEAVLETFVNNFERKSQSLKAIIDPSQDLRDLVIMASIIEKEAATAEDKRIVSGILWKRISIKMPLQVDAPFHYLLGKESSEITQTDLHMKSPYNTYRNLGLPAGPIGNPGIESLRAAIDPKDSPYLFYLSDKKGTIHYARNFEEHKKNRVTYLQ